MHQHVTLFTAWRYRRGLPGAEATLRRIADEGIVLVSTGGADFTQPRGTARARRRRLPGQRAQGLRQPGPRRRRVLDDVRARRRRHDDRVVLNMAVPVSADGVTVLDNWDTLGMRGTGSHDVDDRRRVRARGAGARPPALRRRRPAAAGHRQHRHAGRSRAVYLGVAEAARDAAVAAVAGTARAEDPTIQRQVGLMDNRLRVMSWALDGALRDGRRRPDAVDGRTVVA